MSKQARQFEHPAWRRSLCVCVSARHWTQDSQHQTGGSTARGSSQSGDRCSGSSRRASGADGEPVHGEEEACKQSYLSSVGSADDATGDTSGHGGNNPLARPLSATLDRLLSSKPQRSAVEWKSAILAAANSKPARVGVRVHTCTYLCIYGWVCARTPSRLFACLFVCLFVS